MDGPYREMAFEGMNTGKAGYSKAFTAHVLETCQAGQFCQSHCLLKLAHNLHL